MRLATLQRCIQIGPITALVLQGTQMIGSDHKPQALKSIVTIANAEFVLQIMFHEGNNLPAVRRCCKMAQNTTITIVTTIDWKVTTYSTSMILLPSDALTTTTHWRQHTTTYKPHIVHGSHWNTLTVTSRDVLVDRAAHGVPSD